MNAAGFYETSVYILNIHIIKVKVKIKVTLEQATKAHRGSRSVTLLFLYPRHLGVGDQRHAYSALSQAKTGIDCIGSWVGPRAGLDGCGKCRPPPGLDHRIVQPVASRYTD